MQRSTLPIALALLLLFSAPVAGSATAHAATMKLSVAGYGEATAPAPRVLVLIAAEGEASSPAAALREALVRAAELNKALARVNESSVVRARLLSATVYEMYGSGGLYRASYIVAVEAPVGLLPNVTEAVVEANCRLVSVKPIIGEAARRRLERRALREAVASALSEARLLLTALGVDPSKARVVEVSAASTQSPTPVPEVAVLRSTTSASTVRLPLEVTVRVYVRVVVEAPAPTLR